MFSFTLFVASPSWGTSPGFVVGWEVEGRRMWCLSDNLTVHVWRRNDIWSCGTANAIFQVRNEMHSVQILCYSRSASLQSMASALARYIKKIKRKWGEKWLCMCEISSSSAILCKLADQSRGASRVAQTPKLCTSQFEASTSAPLPGHTLGIWRLFLPGREGIWSPLIGGGEFDR